MKRAIRGGHNYGVTGASKIVDEVTEDRKIYPEVIKWLRAAGEDVLDVTPNRTETKQEDLRYGITKAKAWGAQYFASIHLNCWDTVAPNGSEVFYNPNSPEGKATAERISAKLSSLGFKHRGAKADPDFYEPKNFNPANIVECFFCSSPVDVALYKKLGPGVIGKAIAEGMIGRDIKEIKEEEKELEYLILLNSKGDQEAGFMMSAQYKAPVMVKGTETAAIVNSVKKTENIIEIGGTQKYAGSTHISGSNAGYTLLAVLKHLGYK